MYVFNPFCIRMLQNKTQIAWQKWFWGPRASKSLTGALEPGRIKDFALRRSWCALRVHNLLRPLYLKSWALLHKKIVGIKAKSKSKIRIKPKSRCIKLGEIKPKLNSFKIGKKVTFYGCHGNRDLFYALRALFLCQPIYVWFQALMFDFDPS